MVVRSQVSGGKINPGAANGFRCQRPKELEMADKSPKKDNAKKAGKSLKEKRAAKDAKRREGKGLGSS
jgi:hypothetical protein